jgi:hypothetical protein
MVRRLARLHADAGGRGLAGLGARLREGTGRALLLLAVGALPIGVAWVGGSGLLRAPGSPFLWALLPPGGALAWLILRETLRLARGGMPPGQSLVLLGFLSVVAPAVGVLAAASSLYAATVALSGAAGGEPEPLALAEQAVRGGSVLVLGLLLGIAGGLSWFALTDGARARAEREADALLDEGSGSPPPRVPKVIPLLERRKA